MKLLVPLALAAVICGCASSTSDVQTGSGTSVASNTGNASNDSTNATASKSVKSPATDAEGAASTASYSPADDPSKRQPKKGDDVAVMQTSLGKIVLMFFPDKAPHHVENFIKLSKKGFYDGTKFHRVIPHFMIQGGDPNTKKGDKSTWGMGGPGYTIDAEFNDVKHVRGILSMARSQDPNSAGSQFFIMVAATPSLDGQYSAFGRVVSGMNVVDKIVNLPRDERDCPKNPPVIKSIKIEKWPIK